eukprot:758317-Hanusia_phi.AAC.12
MKQEYGFRPNLQTFNVLIKTCVKGNEWHKAFEVYSQMQLQRIRPSMSTFNALSMAAGEGGDWRRAIDVMVDMR